MNAFVQKLQAQTVDTIDVSLWHFDPESTQTNSTICLQKSLNDCLGFVVVSFRTGVVVAANDSALIGMKANVSAQQIVAHDEFMGAIA